MLSNFLRYERRAKKQKKKTHTHKIEVTPARVHGRDENVRRLRNSPVMNQLLEHPEWMPLLFDERGEELIGV